MIIFDLDGTIADCEHRRHFVDPKKNDGVIEWTDISTEKKYYGYGYENGIFKSWKPDWESFYEACDSDLIIKPMKNIFINTAYGNGHHNVQIWSGRSEMVKQKTVNWLIKNIGDCYLEELKFENTIKMRPIGDFTPDEILKEKWLDEAISQRKKIEYVFDDRPSVVRMWRRRGIFVFNCLQNDEEF